MRVVEGVAQYFRWQIVSWRVRRHAEANAYHGLEGQAGQVLAAEHGTPAAGPTELFADETPPDTTRAQATVNELGEALAPYAWYPLIPILLVFFGFIGWRGSTRLFLASGFPATDAMLLGVMLESFNVFLVWLLHQAWLRPYDGTSRRTVHLTLLTIVYLLLIGCMVALRLGQADPNEPIFLRLANAGLIVASVVGPAFAIEILARIGYRIAPLLYRRNRAARIIRQAEGAHRRNLAQREDLARRTALWSEQATKLENLYEMEYAKAAKRFARGE